MIQNNFIASSGGRSETVRKAGLLHEMTAAETSLIDQIIYERIFKTSIV
jgi:hypothetical protein